MLCRKRIVVQIRVAYRRLQQLGEPDRLVLAVAHDDAAAAENHREARLGEQRGRVGQRRFAARATLDGERTRNLALDVAIEEIARDVELRRSHFELRAVERARGQFGHARRVVDVRLEAGDLGKDRQLLGFLESAETEPHRSGLRRDHDHRRMRPIGGGRGGDKIGDTRSILRDADAVPPGHPRVTVGHMPGALLVRDRDEADAGEREQIERVHEGRANDAENVLDALRDKGLHECLRRRHLLLADDGKRRALGHGVHSDFLCDSTVRMVAASLQRRPATRAKSARGDSHSYSTVSGAVYL